MTPFSAALRSATWSNHRRAEETEYLRALVSGRVDRAGYAEMVAQHYFAYAVLEEAGRVMHHDPVAGAFVDDALVRIPALEQDLGALLGADWSTLVSLSQSTRRYCDRMREVCFDWPAGLVALVARRAGPDRGRDRARLRPQHRRTRGTRRHASRRRPGLVGR